MIVPMTLNGAGIRDIARLLLISPNTVLAELKATTAPLPEPVVPPRIRHLELDEFWSFVQCKANQRWTWHAWDRERKIVVAFVNGRRTDANCRALSRKLAAAQVKHYYSDEWAAYQKFLPASKHTIGKDGTHCIERRNLGFRTRLKRLQRRTICFSKSEQMHDAVIKLHIHHSNLDNHQI